MATQKALLSHMHWTALLILACTHSPGARRDLDSSMPSTSVATTTPTPTTTGSTTAKDTAPVVTPPNVLLVVIDDLGVDFLGTYGAEGGPIPDTPTLDTLADEGLRFTGAWSSPLCSPSRAELLTGLRARRFGLGTAVRYPSVVDLPADAVTLPEHLGARWSSAFLGKWHLTAGDAGLNGPTDQGFDHWSGSLGNLAAENSPTARRDLHYANWEYVTDGELRLTETYATSATVSDAVEQIEALPEPWFIEVAFHAGHAPYHFPPPELLSRDWESGPRGNAYRFGAMIEALDTELGRLLGPVDSTNTLVIVVGDNGTPQNVVPPPAKGSTAETGVNVPLLIRGPEVTPGLVVSAPVAIVDLPATVLDLAGVVPSEPLDGVSLRPCFTDPDCHPHETVFANVFTPNGVGPYNSWMAAVRDDRYKLVEGFHAELQPVTQHSLYDMTASGEDLDLLLGSTREAHLSIYEALLTELDRYMDR